MRRVVSLTFLSLLFFPWPLLSQEPSTPSPASSAPVNVFAEQFLLSPGQQLQYQIQQVDGLAFIEAPDREWNTRYSIVTDFGPSMVRTQLVPGIQNVREIRKWIGNQVRYSDFEGVEIKKVTLPLDGKNQKVRYWVGHRSFSTVEQAEEEIAQLKAVVDAQGGDLEKIIQEAEKVYQIPEAPPPVEVKTDANFKKEEEFVLKMLDKIDFGERLLGPLQGTTAGEPIIWRSFGETTYRRTNLENRNYSTQLGYWTNQVVFEGIKFPLNTINPVLESTINLDGTGIDYKSNLQLIAGLEWRPLQRNAFLTNFQPWGLPLLEWVKNYRFYLNYVNRDNLKDEIRDTKNHDLVAGVQIFYEWGVGLPPINQARPSAFVDYLREYVWGEYFGDYKHSQTGLSSEDDYQAYIAVTSILLGFKTPAIPLPENLLLEELQLMPYFRFEQTHNDEFSFASDNRLILGAGVRWMPFRSYRFENNEWLSKVKIFGEYLGVGDVQHFKQNDEPSLDITYDLRFGVSISSKRY